MELELQFNVDPRNMMSDRNMNRHRRVVNAAMMKYWHRKIRKKHFTQQGGREYKYQPRTVATRVIKRLTYGHSLPIRAKGLAESMTGSIKSLRVTPTVGRLVMHGPWYLGQRVERQRGGLSPDLKDELTRVSMDDAQTMAEVGSDILNKRLEQDKRRRLGAHTERP